MNQQQFIQEFRTYPKEQKSAVIEELLQICREEQNGSENGLETRNGNSKSFEIRPFSLGPRSNFDFDNIEKLISEIEGDFHK